MATLIVGGIGAAIGSFLGPGGALKGFQIGATIGGMIDAANRPGVHQEVGRLSDLRVSGSSYGTIIPQVWGGTRVPGIVIWSTDLIEHSKTVRQGGKGISGPSTTTYSYTASFACAIARGGRNIQIKRIWADDLILWDSSAPNTNVTFRVYQGTETQSPDTLIQSLLPKTPAYRGMAYVVFQDLQLANFSNRIPNISFEITTDPVTVGNIMSDVAAQTPLKPSDIDVSLATTPVTGYQLNTQAAAKDVMAQLLTMYLYDNVEVDGVLRLQPRGGAAVCQIGTDEIGAVLEGNKAGDTTVPGVSTVRAQEIELPQIVQVVYFAPSKYYEQLTQQAIKQVAMTPNIVTLTTTLSLDDTVAKQMASTQLYNTWLERTSFIYSVLPKYRYLVPGDVVQLPIGDALTLTRMRISALGLGLPGEVRLTCLLDDAGPLTQFVAGTVGTSANAPPVAFGVAVPSDFIAWSGTELRNADQSAPGFYVAASGAAGWRGAEVFYSTDGNTYEDGGRISQKSVLGNCNTTLQDYAGGAAQDTASSLGVTVLDGALLTSTSDVAAQLGDNPAILVSGGASKEVLTFATATLTAAGTYTLSRFFRGERGSPSTGHVAGEQFVLGGGGIARISVPASLVGTTVYVKVVSDYQQLSDVAAKALVIAARTPTATEAAISAIPAPPPFYRVTGYINSQRGTGDHIDASYFGTGANVPANTVQFNYTQYASGPGGSISEQGTLNWAKHYRMGLTNSSSAAITVHYFLPYIDNFVGITWAGTSELSRATNDGNIANVAGSFSVAAGQSGILELFFFNEQSTFPDNGNNVSVFSVLLDALDQAGMTFYDAGPGS